MATPTDRHSEDLGPLSLSDALHVMARWKWVIVAFTLVLGIAAFAYAATRAKQYTATAKLKYQQQVDYTNPLGDTSVTSPDKVKLELSSIASQLTSPTITGQVATTVNLPSDSKSLNVTVNVVTDTSVAGIVAVSPSAQLSAAIANAYAAVFIGVNKAAQRQQLQEGVRVIKQKLQAFAALVTHSSPDYILLTQRLRDLQIAKAATTGDYVLISPAVPPDAPSSPHPKRDAAIGLTAGLLLGVAVALLLEQLNTRLRSHREVSEILQLPMVGRVPRISKTVLHETALDVIREPMGHAAESFRLLRSNLDFLDPDAAVTAILVTSCVQGEGKSVTVSNLAVSLAMVGRKVIVIDGDMRRPRMHQFFGLDNQTGLSTVVSGKTTLSNSLQEYVLPAHEWSNNGDGAGPETVEADQPPRLYVLTSGPLPPNPGELLASEKFGQILEEARQRADIVLVDSPAFMPVSDAAAIAPKVDGMFMLVSMENVTRPMLTEARELLAQLPCRKLGVIVVRERDGRDGYGYHGYHYRSYEGESAEKRPAKSKA